MNMESNIYKAARMTRWLAYGILTVALACLLAGCNGDSGAPEATPAETELTEPTDTVEPAPTPTPEPTVGSAVPQRTATPVPTPTPTAEGRPASTQAPIVTPTPTPTAPATPGSTQAPADLYAVAASVIPFFDEWLSEYETWCYEMQNVRSLLRDSTDVTYGELSAALAKLISRTPAINPPDVVARWQNAQDFGLQVYKNVVDEQPTGDTVDLVLLQEHVKAWVVEHEITQEELEKFDVDDEEIPVYVRNQMAPAGCVFQAYRPDAATLVAVEFPNATPVAPGESVAGSIDPNPYNAEYFRFQVEEGQSYVIVATLYPPSGSMGLRDADGQSIPLPRAVYGAEGRYIPFSDVWQPPSSGEYYFMIASRQEDSATYRLKLIDLSDIDDDHGNSPEDATSIAVGQNVAGAVDEWLDVDHFRFQAEEGQLYRIEVVTGTLPDAHLYIEDFDEWNFSAESSEGGRSFVGEAPGTGTYWIAVGHAEPGTTGTYTLTVTAL